MPQREEAHRPKASGTRPRKRSLTIAGHRTSVSLEDAFWDALKEFAEADNKSLPELVGEIDSRRSGAGLSSAIRVYVLVRVRERPRPI